MQSFSTSTITRSKKKFSLLLTVLQSRKTVSTAHEKARSLYRSKLRRTWEPRSFSYAAKQQCWEKAERVPGEVAPACRLDLRGLGVLSTADRSTEWGGGASFKLKQQVNSSNTSQTYHRDNN